jgi:hypothetical protein
MHLSRLVFLFSKDARIARIARDFLLKARTAADPISPWHLVACPTRLGPRVSRASLSLSRAPLRARLRLCSRRADAR